MIRPLVSFVLIEYHSLEELPPAIAAMEAACGELPHEIVISSNSAYPPAERDGIRARFPGTHWVFNATNGGFASGMNAGIRETGGEWIILSNPDARIVSGSLASLIGWFAEHPRAAVTGPRIVGPDGVAQDSCRRFMTLPAFVARQFRRFTSGRTVLPEQGFDPEAIQRVDWVIGGFMAIRRAALEDVGLLDEGYFLYVEDMDWCKRFWDAGWEVWYYPDMTVCYAGDRKSTAGMAAGRVTRYSWWHLRSYARFLTRHGLFPRRRERTS